MHSSAVKNSPAMQEMWEMPGRSLCWEDSLEKEVAIHSSIHARKIPWTEEPGRLQSMAHKELDTTDQLSIYTHSKWMG